MDREGRVTGGVFPRHIEQVRARASCLPSPSTPPEYFPLRLVSAERAYKRNEGREKMVVVMRGRMRDVTDYKEREVTKERKHWWRGTEVWDAANVDH